MGTYTGNDLVTRAETLVQDQDAIRWPLAELPLWIDDAQREICIKKPSAFTKHANYSLAASAKQAITSLTDGHAVLDVLWNMSAADVPGAAIRRVDKSVLTAQLPSWPTSKGTDIKHWMQGEEPKVFYVYPALHKAGTARKVELLYAAVPPEYVALSQAIALDDIYANAIGYYLLFRMYSKESDEASNAAAAQAYYTLFTQSLGG